MEMKLAFEQIRLLTELSERAGRKFSGLIVDDEPMMGGALLEFCELAPALQVELCDSGLSAIELVSKSPVDFVTVDLVMPEISGVETVRLLRQNNPDLPIIVITGNATEKVKTAARCAGACNVLNKPIDIAEFLGEILELLRERMSSSTGISD